MKSSNQSFFLIFSLSLLVSCASFNPFAGNSGPVSREIGPDGGSITSADGSVTLSFPAGALGQNEMITLEKIDPEILGPEFDEIRPHLTIDSAYELSPDGLTFDVPVHVTMNTDQKTSENNGTIQLEAEIPFTSSGGVLKVLENPGIVQDAEGSVSVHGDLMSFSKLAKARDVGFSVSTVSSEQIEQTDAGKSLESILSITPNLNLNAEQPVITQSYQKPLTFINATQISQIPTITADYDQFSRTFNYACNKNGPAVVITNTNFTFSETTPINVLRNKNYNLQNEVLVDCFFPDNSEPDYNFQITDLGGEFSDDISGRLTLSVSYKLDKEIADYSLFKINWGDGYENTYNPTAPETSWGQDVSNNNIDSESTYVFKTSHQYRTPFTPETYFFNISTEAWAPDNQTPEREWEGVELTLNKRFSNNWQLLGSSFYENSESKYSSYFGNNRSDNLDLGKSGWSLSPSEIQNPVIIDQNLQIDFSDFNQSLDAYPLFSVDKVQFGENSWTYHLDYSLDFAEKFKLSPTIRYTEFPQNNGIQPLQFDFDPTQAAPVIIQINENNQPTLVDNFDLVNPSLPTRIITIPLLSEYFKKYDEEDTSVRIPEATLTIQTRGSGNGTLFGRVLNNAGSSGFNTNSDVTNSWTTLSEADREDLEDIFPIQNGDYFRCSDRCEFLFVKNTEIEVTPRANAGSTFLGLENNLTREDNGTYKFKLSDDFDLTAFFEDPEKEDEEQYQSTDKVFQTRTATGARIFGSSYQVGAKMDWATRSSFENAVCDQEGLLNCTSDGLTPVLVLFGETSLFDWNLSDQGIGTVPILFGASLSLSQVGFEQNYAYGTTSPMPYDINGKTGIVSLDTYLQARRSFKPVLSLPGRPAFTPYANLGMSNIWNCTDFEFMSDDENFDYHREHHGVHFIGGFGTDVNFNGPWGLRFNMDYTAGGADANLRFGAGVTFSPRSYRLGHRFRF